MLTVRGPDNGSVCQRNPYKLCLTALKLPRETEHKTTSATTGFSVYAIVACRACRTKWNHDFVTQLQGLYAGALLRNDAYDLMSNYEFGRCV